MRDKKKFFLKKKKHATRRQQQSPPVKYIHQPPQIHPSTTSSTCQKKSEKSREFLKNKQKSPLLFRWAAADGKNSGMKRCSNPKSVHCSNLCDRACKWAIRSQDRIEENHKNKIVDTIFQLTELATYWASNSEKPESIIQSETLGKSEPPILVSLKLWTPFSLLPN